jgi:hypothetical protein
MPDHIKQASMAGAIGEGPAAEFWGFVDVWGKMPKMADIEAKPDKVHHDAQEYSAIPHLPAADGPRIRGARLAAGAAA